VTARSDTPERLAEPLAALSVATDLARGQPPEQALHATVLATRLATRLGLDAATQRDVYYATLMRFVGCTATSHEYARYLGGNDIDVRYRGDRIDAADQKQVLGFLLATGHARAPLQRLSAFAGALVHAKAVIEEASRADCEIASRMANRLGLGVGVANSLLHLFERWDGKGSPNGVRGPDIPLPARIGAVAFTAVMFQLADGVHAALEAVRAWSGGILDPEVVTCLTAHRGELLVSGDNDPWQEVLDIEPGLPRRIDDAGLENLCLAFADFVDLKTPHLLGHSTRVASLAEAGAKRLGLAAEEALRVRRAALLHDLGRVAVSTGIWEKARLTMAEAEQARLHPYHSERILVRSAILRPFAPLAAAHHERLDGSGYFRGLDASSQDTACRLLAAADACAELLEERPGRPAFSTETLPQALFRESLDYDAARAVVEAAGATTIARREWPAGLTDREVEVLRLLAKSRSMKQIAAELVISQSTVHTHVAHIYEKAGISTRAGAAMFAMEHGLLR
jgi:HD-GYP domain-containing protein (c-di-GMP phosphodiesterase class II)/DNA-binding CsgD family transcriptional regulator